MKNTFLAAAVAVAAITSTSAHAQTFNGPYAGGTVGYDKLAIEVDTGEAAGSVSGDGVAGGLVLGYNATLGSSAVVGFELEGALGGGSIEVEGDEVSTDYTANVGIRAGFLASDKVLIFGKLAYARTGLGIDGESEAGDGVAFGGGVEFAFSDTLSGRVGYTRTSYSVDEDAEDLIGADVNINRDQVLASILFHF